MRHCAVSQKIVVSIPDEVIGIFQSLNTTDRIMALGPIQPLTEMSKVKCTLAQALRLCIGRMAHRVSRGIALLFHDHGTKRGEGSA